MKIGANGTPTFIVGKSAGAGVDGELLIGAMPFPMFDAKLKELQNTK
jgi:protein-disulfide isomerase